MQQKCKAPPSPPSPATSCEPCRPPLWPAPEICCRKINTTVQCKNASLLTSIKPTCKRRKQELQYRTQGLPCLLEGGSFSENFSRMFLYLTIWNELVFIFDQMKWTCLHIQLYEMNLFSFPIIWTELTIINIYQFTTVNLNWTDTIINWKVNRGFIPCNQMWRWKYCSSTT